MKLYEIKNKIGEVSHAVRAVSLRAAVEDAVRLRVSLINVVLRGANLTWANLIGANLTWANLTGAKTTNIYWPSATMILLAEWGPVSDELCLDLMRYDAANHNNPGLFIAWAAGGACPYAGSRIVRAAHFQEQPHLIKTDFLSLPVKSAHELVCMLAKEKGFDYL